MAQKAVVVPRIYKRPILFFYPNFSNMFNQSIKKKKTLVMLGNRVGFQQ